MSTSKTEKVLFAAMNNVNCFAALMGGTAAYLGFDYFRRSDLPQGIDDMEQMAFGGLVLGIMGMIVTFMTLGGAYWLNNGSKEFKNTFSAVLAVLVCMIIILRGVLPEVEKTVDDGIMAEYDKYYTNRQAQSIVDACQGKHECCGYFGIRDFPPHRRLPDSCCNKRNLRKNRHCIRELAYPDPCRHKLAEMISTYFQMMDVLCYVTASTLVALILIVQVVGLFFNKKTYSGKRKWDEAF